MPAVPASVVTSPAGEFFRMVRLLLSLTKRLPFRSMAKPSGELNRAATPEPSALPGWPAAPAKIVTKPAGEIFRIVWLPESVT